jgi:hypothetical protein
MQPTEDVSRVELVKDYPKQVFPDPPPRPPEYLAYLDKATHALKSIRLVVNAGMSGFILLSAYGFFLIYQLTSDARTMANQTRLMTAQMELMSHEMRGIATVMGDMRANMADMSASMTGMRGSMDEMNHHMAAMDSTTARMANTAALIQHSARNLDASFGPGMNMMNHFIPFGGGGNNWPGPPPFAPPGP